jgi:hypothetical protein
MVQFLKGSEKVVEMVVHLHPMNCIHHNTYYQDPSSVFFASYIADGVHGPEEK